ncbi:MAG: NADH-quinone oxidoreductase subunit J [Tepidisphaeraceae bacterium]|jgi:NADH-quinone oxidoreductase subunit J
MLGIQSTSLPPMPLLLADGAVIAPLAILVLCVVAGVGTILLLPSRRQPGQRKLGGALLLAAGLILAALLVKTAAGQDVSGTGPYFWIFSAIALAGAMRVITHPRPVYSALYFVLTVFASAGLFVLMYAEFMAAALVLIYAGAILVTYVFVIMLAASAQSQSQTALGGGLAGLTECDVVSREPLVAACIGFALMGVLLFLIFDKAGQIAPPPSPAAVPAAAVAAPDAESIHGSTQALGAYLFTDQLVNLELAGLILTVAMVGAIIIARRRVPSVEDAFEPSSETITAALTPLSDDPHSIPVYGTTNPAQKAFPET